VERELAGELRATLAAARAWLREALEEGLESYEPTAVDARPALANESRAAPAARADAPASGAPPAVRPAVRAPAPAAGVEPMLPIAPATAWGARPTLEQVRAAIGECTRCRLAEGRSRIVFGDGAPDAALMFIGEGPGEQEDRQGLPFVGRAGELLTQMIEKGLRVPRSAVYICNIVKCRPPNNRVPLADEVAACRPFLDGQIAAVQPKVIVALGKPATSLLLGRDVAISRVRGIWQEYDGIPVMPTFHPAFLLRQYTPENRRLVWEDLKAALARVRELGGRLPELDGDAPRRGA